MSVWPELRELMRVGAIADELIDVERLGKPRPLPESWVPGDTCPSTGQPCQSQRCWSAGECPLRPTLTSRLAAEAGRHLARWAAGAEGMCAGCAFREGTRANRTDGTIIDVMQCFQSGQPFMCHDGLKHGETPREVCRGWLALARPSDAPE